MEEVKYLEEELDKCRKLSEEFPALALRVRSGDRYRRYGIVSEKARDCRGKMKEVYLQKQDIRLPGLLEKYCAEQVMRVVADELQKLKEKPADYHPENIESKKQELEKLLGSDMPDSFESIKTKAYKWANGVYQQSKSHVEEKRIHTLKGDLVRSKIEEIVANLLYTWHIPYRYENPVALSNDRVIHPDFTIMSPKTGKIYYLEVCGMMDKADYVDTTTRRVYDLAEVGIFFGKNLMLVFDTPDAPFSVKHLRNMLLNCL